ncbi:MAG: hypothetical protein NT150_13005 [Bacteroidetes bacterium]|nr:hypothetical protein [Bacteroidota bacterium]
MLKKALISFIIIVAFAFALDRLFQFGLSHNINLKATHVSRGELLTEVLVDGPCEPLFTMDPAYLQLKTGKSFYNLSLNHSDFADNYLHLHLYLKNNPAPKYLFLFATPESFDTRFNTFHPYRFAAFLSDSTVEAVVAEHDKEYVTWMKVPLLRYTYFGNQLTFPAIQGVKHWLTNKKEPYFKNGHQAHPSSRSLANPLHFVQLDEYGNKPEDAENKSFVWDAKREKYFRLILQAAQDKGIKVVVYESPGYAGILTTQPNRLEMLQKIKNISAEYGNPYWVFAQLPLAVEKSNFICPLIMNSAASKDFMDTLSLRINKLR